jgi:hypothetical protein
VVEYPAMTDTLGWKAPIPRRYSAVCMDQLKPAFRLGLHWAESLTSGSTIPGLHIVPPFPLHPLTRRPKIPKLHPAEAREVISPFRLDRAADRSGDVAVELLCPRVARAGYPAWGCDDGSLEEGIPFETSERLVPWSVTAHDTIRRSEIGLS